MNANSRKRADNAKLILSARFILALFVILVAAAHLAFVTPASASSNFQEFALWINIEVVAYTVIAVIYLLGVRTWYLPASLFNAFNVILYFLSGVVAIPGLTSAAYGGHLNIASSLVITVMVVSWLSSLILGLVMLKYDRGSELDKLLVAQKAG